MIEDIPEKLRRLRAISQGTRLMGTRPLRDYALWSPAERAWVAQIEQRLGVRLPEGYRQFILEVGDGGDGPEGELLPLGVALKVSERMYGYLGKWEPAVPFSRTRETSGLSTGSEPPSDEEGIERGCLVIADQGCGYYAHLVLTGKERGQVWQEWLEPYEGICFTGMSFLEWYEDWLDAEIARHLGEGKGS